MTARGTAHAVIGATPAAVRAVVGPLDAHAALVHQATVETARQERLSSLVAPPCAKREWRGRPGVLACRGCDGPAPAIAASREGGHD